MGARVEELELAGRSGALRAAFLAPDPAAPGLAPGGRGPAVLVVHAGCGRERGARRAAERFAAGGSAALVVAPGPGADGAHVPAGFEQRAVLADLETALAWLAGRAEVDPRRVAVAGACLGGTLAFLLGCTSTRVCAALAFHAPLVYPELDAGRPIQPLELALNLGCPLFACYGQRDAVVPAADVERLRRTLATAAKELELVTVPGAAHGFLEEGGAAFAPEGAEEAWHRALAFLRAAT